MSRSKRMVNDRSGAVRFVTRFESFKPWFVVIGLIALLGLFTTFDHWGMK